MNGKWQSFTDMKVIDATKPLHTQRTLWPLNFAISYIKQFYPFYFGTYATYITKSNQERTLDCCSKLFTGPMIFLTPKKEHCQCVCVKALKLLRLCNYSAHSTNPQCIKPARLHAGNVSKNTNAQRYFVFNVARCSFMQDVIQCTKYIITGLTNNLKTNTHTCT